MKRKILALLLTGAFIFGLTGCGNGSSTNTTENKESSTKEDSSSNETTSSEDSSLTDDYAPSGSATPKLDVVDIDMYNELKDTQYISVVLHNPEANVPEDWKTKGTDPIIAVYDMGASMKDTFTTPFDTFVTSTKLGYRFTIANENYAIQDACTSTDFQKGLVHFSQYESKKTSSGVPYLSWKENPNRKDTVLVDYYILKEQKKDYDYTQKGSVVQYLSNKDNSWFTTTYLSDGKLTEDCYIDNLFIRTAEDQKNNYYVHTALNTTLFYKDDITQTIDKQLQTLPKGQIHVLKSVKDLDSAITSYGENYGTDLSDTVFYQDILASKISANYGLNLKDKMDFYRTETSYIQFNHADEYVVILNIAYESDDCSYAEFSKCEDSEKFEYTDRDGNKYSYFYQDYSIYIFKNEEFSHAKIVFDRDSSLEWFEALNYIFGIRK